MRASFDWDGASSEHNLPAFWKHDLQQHPSVYKKLGENLGADNPMAKLIKKELDKDDQKAATSKMSSLASEQLTGDSFRTSFPQGGVLRHRLAHLELTFAALAQGQRACSTLA